MNRLPILFLLSIALPSLAATSRTIGGVAPAISPASALAKNAGRIARATHETGVTLNVKDEEVRKIMATMQKQCAVKNLVIDPDVQARGTFVFHQVPCSTAFKVVLQSLALGSVDYGNSVITVGTRKR